MHVEEIRDYCLSKQNVDESFPFDNETLVFKVHGKIFLLLSLNQSPPRFNVKCNPDQAIELRNYYSCVQPGYHMNKKHWNTIFCDGSVSQKILISWIDHSYQLVLASIPKKRRI